MVRRGLTLIEVLTASLLVVVSISALVSLWNVASISILQSGKINAAGQIARAEIERAKVYGAKNFPTGVYSSGTQKGTWSGSYDPTANSGTGGWVSGAVSYYDYQGVRLASSSGASFSLLLSVQDSEPLPATSGTGYTIDVRTSRAVVATVTRLSDNTVLFSSGTNMVIGGL